MGFQVTVDPELCIGSGDCVRVLPEAFRIDDRIGVSVAQPGATIADEPSLLAAAQGCPTQAIRVIDANGTVLHAANGDRLAGRGSSR